MSKVIITIIDKPDGEVGVTFRFIPPGDERPCTPAQFTAIQILRGLDAQEDAAGDTGEHE